MKRRGFRFVTVAAFLVVVGVGPSTVVSAALVPTIDQIASAIQFPESFGLRADLDFVTTMASSESADVTSYGVPLTADELADLAARATLRDDFTPALAAAIESPATPGPT